ncbi:MAG: hypothetical protein GWP19_00165 [Planctomycetia bacterium]|nr:hypothetical protein [Planctomycetia bacterium]
MTTEVMTSPFEIRNSNVKVEIESVTVNEETGKVDVKFKVKDPRVALFQLILAQYSTGGAYSNMTLLPDEVRDDFTVIDLNESNAAIAEYTYYLIVWDSGEDLELENYPTVSVKIQGQDSDGTADTESIIDTTFALNIRPVILDTALPVEFLKDGTPAIAFNVPTAVKPCNMHIILTVANNAELVDPFILTLSLNLTGWQFQDSGGIYRDFLNPGCPSVDALFGGAKCRYTASSALTTGLWYYRFTIYDVYKKITEAEMGAIPLGYVYYPENLYFDMSLLPYGIPVNWLEVNPEDALNPEDY